MKKIIGMFLALTFIAVLSAGSFARTLGEEKQAVRDYLKVIDAKIVKFRVQGNTVKMKQMQAEKQATLRRWEALKTKMESAETPWVPPTPAPVAPAQKPVAASAGMGMSVGAKVGLTAGLFAVTGDLDYSLAGILPGAKARLSVDYVTGNNPNSTATIDNAMKSVDVKIGGTYALDMLKTAALPVDWYVGAAYILPVKVNSARTGGYGYEGYVGGTYNVPDFGTIYGELGYGALKYASTAAALKGVNAAVGYAYSF